MENRYVMLTIFEGDKMMNGIDLYTKLTDEDLKKEYEYEGSTLEIINIDDINVLDVIFNDDGEVIRRHNL